MNKYFRVVFLLAAIVFSIPVFVPNVRKNLELFSIDEIWFHFVLVFHRNFNRFLSVRNMYGNFSSNCGCIKKFILSWWRYWTVLFDNFIHIKLFSTSNNYELYESTIYGAYVNRSIGCKICSIYIFNCIFIYILAFSITYNMDNVCLFHCHCDDMYDYFKKVNYSSGLR